MRIPITVPTLIIIGLILIAISIAAGLYLGSKYKERLVEKAKQQKKDEADRLLEEAKESARLMEIQARDQALKVLQKAENDIERKRNDLTKEEDRLTKRREELDNRLDRM